MIPQDWNLAPDMITRLGSNISRQRMIHEDGQTLIIVHHKPLVGESHRQSFFLWREKAGAKWKTHSTKEGGASTLEQLIEEYDERIELLDDQFDEGVGLKEHFAVLEELNPLLRAIRNISSVLDASLQIYPKDPLLVETSEKAHAVTRMADLLLMSVKNNLEYLQASQLEVDNQLNHRVAIAAHKLNLIVAMFLPLTAITSLFGMNLMNGYEEAGTMYFKWVLIGGLSLGTILVLFIGRFPALPVLKSLPRKLILNNLKELSKIRIKKETKN